MRDFLSIEREVNAIRLRRTIFTGAFVLVEGYSDRVFYERFTDKKTCELVSLSGKLRVIEVLRQLELASLPGILGIVDTDFDRLNGSLPISPNLILTDTHDQETMLISSPALDKVVAELGSKEKISKLPKDVRSTLIAAGKPIGYLLWISQLDEMNLTFASIEFKKFINDRTLEIDESKLIQEVKNKSQAHALKDADLQKRLTNQKSGRHDPWQVCCGHHLVAILSMGLRKAIGSAKTDIEPDSLERSLRLAYETEYFYQTQMYDSIRLWESKNQPFKILQGERRSP